MKTTNSASLRTWNANFTTHAIVHTMCNFLRYAVLSAALISPSLVLGSDQIPGRPQTKAIAIVAATIHTVSDGTVESGVVLIEDGKISAIGEDVEIPDDCQVIEAQGKHVYPSLIEAYSDLGLVEINSVSATIDSSETGDMNPNVRAIAAFNPDSELIPVNRANGILLAVTAPSGGVLSGRSALMMLDGWTAEDMCLADDCGLQMSWPRGKEDVEALESMFEDAKRYADARKSSTTQPKDLRLEALLPVLSGEVPVYVEARRVEDIQAAIAFANRHSLKLVLRGAADLASVASLLKDEDIPVVVSGVYRNPSRRHAAFDEGYTLPHRLSEAGVQFCISAGGRFGASGIRNLPYHAATAAAYGLSEEEALRAITLSPAEILGVSDRVGSLRVGKDATLFIADGSILETPTQVIAAYVQGREVDLSNKHTQLYRKYSAKYDSAD